MMAQMAAAGAAEGGWRPQLWVAAAAAAGLGAVIWAAYEVGGPRVALAAPIGALGGLALYHAAFGFTGAWRRLQRERRGAGVRAQILLLAVLAITAYPWLGGLYGDAPNGWVFPIGLASALGAAAFGFGMQLGGGCGSGVLFTVGGGSSRMVITLLAFLAGSVLYTASADLWRDLPRLPAVSLVREFGVIGALAATLAVLGLLYLWVSGLERRRHGALEARAARGAARRWISGPWSREGAALILALVVLLCFAVYGRPWGVTAAFPLWGAKLGDAVGLPIDQIPAWSGDRLDRSVFQGVTSVMNFGVMLGALLAAGLAGKFAPKAGLSLRDVATAILGGLLMGYGARLAFGCNIGGLIGGVASASLHGWWWLLFGAFGSVAGVWARRWIGMDPPPPR